MRERFLATTLALTLAATTAGCGDGRPNVDVSGLPAELPPPVSQAVPNVVKIISGWTGPDGQDKQSHGTGFRIAPDAILAAGHVVDESLICDGTHVLSPTAEPVGYGSGATHGIRTTADEIRTGYPAGEDAALLTSSAQETDKMYPYRPLSVRDTSIEPLQPGEPLFMVGYGIGDVYAEQTESERSPLESDLSEEERQAGFTTPWIIGAVVLSTSETGRILAATGLTDYSTGLRRAEAASSLADSGGPLLDAQGRAVGILTHGRAAIAIDALETEAGVDMEGLPPRYDASGLAFTPLTGALIAGLHGLPPKPCAA